MRAWVALAVLSLLGFGLIETGMVPLPELGRVTKFMQPAPSISLPGVDLKSLSSEYGFLEGSFVISNASGFPITAAAIHCDMHGPGGTVVHTFDFVAHELVPANSKKTISNYKFGFWPQQSSQMVCKSISAERR
jgi:hypothetical protein